MDLELTNETGPLVERKSGDLKEKLLKDVYNLYLFGDSFCESYPNMRVVQSCLKNVSLFRFWSPANQFPDLVRRLHVQVRLMVNFGLNGSLPWI